MPHRQSLGLLHTPQTRQSIRVSRHHIHPDQSGQGALVPVRVKDLLRTRCLRRSLNHKRPLSLTWESTAKCKRALIITTTLLRFSKALVHKHRLRRFLLARQSQLEVRRRRQSPQSQVVHLHQSVPPPSLPQPLLPHHPQQPLVFQSGLLRLRDHRLQQGQADPVYRHLLLRLQLASRHQVYPPGTIHRAHTECPHHLSCPSKSLPSRGRRQRQCHRSHLT